MGKHAQRHVKARMIRAAAAGNPIHGEALAISWIEAEGAAADAPKRFTTLAYTGGPMLVANYEAPVVIDLAGLTADQSVPMLMGHDHSAIVGHTDSIDIQATQLKAAGAISGIGTHAQEVLATARNGFPWKTSVGVMPQKMEFLRQGDTAKVNGRTVNGPAYITRKGSLQEISFVAVAADSKTSAKVAATAAHTRKENDMEFKEWVIEATGLNVDELRDDQTALLQGKYDEAVKAAAIKAEAAKKEGKSIEGAAKVDVPEFDLRGVLLTYESHVAQIEAAGAEYVGKITEPAKAAEIQRNAAVEAAGFKQKALNEQWTVPRLEAEFIKAVAKHRGELYLAALPKGPGVRSSSQDVSAPVIEAAMCLAANLHGIEKAYDEKILEAAAAHNRREGASLQAMILASAANAGYSGARRIHGGNFGEVMKYARIDASAPSTHSLTTMLSTVGNKFILEGFTWVEQVWREFSSIVSHSDFKTVTRYRMLDDMVFEELGPAGVIKHGTASQESFTNVARTYAKMFTLTRQDIINDDLGAFDSIRQRIGRGSGIKLNNIFWTAFLDDAAFFTSARSNLITAVLGEPGIAAAQLGLDSQTDGHSNPVDFGGDHALLTGPTLEPTARKWYVSQEIRDTTASTKTPTSNIYQNKYRPLKSRYITSTTAWYLVPINGASMAPMEVCFLDGVQAPTVDSSDAEFNTLGVMFRGYWDFGCAKHEWRTTVKSTGAG